MKIQVRFAGFYRTLAGHSAIDLDLSEGATVEDAIAKLDDLLEGRLHEIFYADNSNVTHPDLLILLDTKIVSRDAVLEEQNVLAFVPPMAGGHL